MGRYNSKSKFRVQRYSKIPSIKSEFARRFGFLRLWSFFGTWNVELESFSTVLSKRCLTSRKDQSARLLGVRLELLMTFAPSATISGATARWLVALVARGEVFIHAVGGNGGASVLQFARRVKLEIRFRKYIRADVAAFHHKVAEPDAVAACVSFIHPPHLRHGGDLRHGQRRFPAVADFLFRKK